MLATNLLGICAYLVLVSHGGWKIASEQAQGIDVTTGEPFVWASAAFPIYALFFLVNAVSAAWILKRRSWWSGRLWLLNCLLWSIAICIDFAHH